MLYEVITSYLVFFVFIFVYSKRNDFYMSQIEDGKLKFDAQEKLYVKQINELKDVVSGYELAASEALRFQNRTEAFFKDFMVMAKSKSSRITSYNVCYTKLLRLWDTKNNYGGLNHYMLPNWNGNDLASPKYGNIAIDKLLERMLQLGSNIKDIQAKIFGGGEMLETSTGKPTLIGERNIRVARLMLEEKKIQIGRRWSAGSGRDR